MRTSWKVGRLCLFASAALIVVAVLWRAARTVEWGNRLHRSRAFRAAASVYRANLGEVRGRQIAAYNLGTALLQAESDEAERYLELAAEGPDSTVAQRAHYNIGYDMLRVTEGSSDQVSGVAQLLASIKSNRVALRLDPDDEDARWNLAVAQRRYESFSRMYEEGQAEQTVGEEGPPPENEQGAGRDAGVGAGADEDGSPPDDSRNAQGGGAGAREALLGEGDPGPLTERGARLLLEELPDDPVLLVRGVLWSQRPENR